MKRRFDLEPGEAILEEWTAGIPSKSGRTSSVGGTLVLTNRRLIWEALRVGPGFNTLIAGLVEKAAHGIPLQSITDVRPDPERDPLLLVAADGDSMRLVVSASRWSPIWSKKNAEARDEAVARIRGACGI